MIECGRRPPGRGQSRGTRRVTGVAGVCLVVELLLALGGASPTRAESSHSPDVCRLQIRVSERGLTLIASEVPRLALLDLLAARFGFELVVWDWSNPRVRVTARDQSLEAILDGVLAGTPYALRYDREAEDQPTRVARLELGEPAALPQGAEAPLEPVDPQGDALERASTNLTVRSRELPVDGPRLQRAMERRYDEDDLRRVRDRRARAEAARRERRLAELESPDPEVRARATFGLDAENPDDIPLLGDSLADPDPRIRAEAARQLQFGEVGDAIPLLRVALADRETEVVLEAIDSLAFLRDDSVLRDLEPLLEHENARVRTEASKAIGRLR